MVRCSFYLKDGEIVSASRGGGDYDASTVHLRTHPKMIELFNKMPDLVLDELYIHGRSLQYISGTARLESGESRCNELEYYIYDTMDANMTAQERWNYISDEIAPILGIVDFDPNANWNEDDLKVRIVPEEEVHSEAS